MHQTCYLCGVLITEDPSVDHVPPRQFFGPSIRKTQNLDRLVTLPTHRACNEAYALDEEYTTATLVPIAMGSPAADAVIEHHARKFRAGQSVPLGHKVLSQFVERPSGLYLPKGLIKLEVEGDRVSRVLWKIVRGLYWIEHRNVLPDDTPYALEIFEPELPDESKHPEVWEAVKSQPSKGTYRGVFDYKYLHAVAGNLEVHAWGMLLWDKIMALLVHVPIGAERPAST